MLPQNNPDRIRIVFDDHRLVANAGLLDISTPATINIEPTATVPSMVSRVRPSVVRIETDRKQRFRSDI